MLYSEQSLPVDSYMSPQIKPGLDYPGKRPEGAFMTDGTKVRLLPDSYDDFVTVADEHLQAAGLPLIAQRTPVLSYGANASPPRLRGKMALFGADEQVLMQTVPHISATLPGKNAVWHGRPAQNGSVFAELYASDSPEDSIQAHVAFLTVEQLAAIHVSEGATYSAARMDAVLGTQDHEHDDVLTPAVKILGYIALDASILMYAGKPVLVEGLRQQAQGSIRLSAEQAVQYMLDSTSDSHQFRDTASLMADMKDKTLAEKKQRQAELGGALLAQGSAVRYEFPLEHARPIGRADFSPPALHDNSGFVHLPELALARIHPSDEAVTAGTEIRMAKDPSWSYEKARNATLAAINPARRISRRAHEELAIRLQKH